MVMRVKVVDGEFRLVLPHEALSDLNVKDGDRFEVTPIAESSESNHETATLEEGMAAYRKFEAGHRATFIELAK